MTKTTLPISLLVVSLVLPVAAGAQVRATVEIGLPVVLPQLVVVAPGVQVVPEIDHEVFFVDGFYYARHDGGWYRSHSHRGGWAYVPPPRVPGRIASFAPGKYKRWKPGKHGPGPGRMAKRDGPHYGHDSRGRDDGHGKHGGKHGKH